MMAPLRNNALIAHLHTKTECPAMTKPENRVHPRSQYFLLKEDGHPVPVYAFRDANDVVATPALVVNMSDGGVQVLTSSSDAPDEAEYDLQIAHADELDSALEHIRIAKVWQRADGVNTRTGFAFRQGGETPAILERYLSKAEHHVLRCILHPVAG